MKTQDLSAFDEKPSTSSDALAGLIKQARELIDIEKEIADVEALLKRLNGKANDLKLKVIPDKMAEIGLSEYTIADGHNLKVEDFVSGTLPKDARKRAAAVELVEAMGGAGIIKNEITLTFDKSQHNEALALAEDLRARGFPAEIKSGIHPHAYLAFIREHLRAGDKVDSEALGVFVGRKTKVELAK